MSLGKPWEYDVEVLHKGKKNVYIFVWKARNISFLSTTEIDQCKGRKIEKQKVFLSTNCKDFEREVHGSNFIFSCFTQDQHKARLKFHQS